MCHSCVEIDEQIEQYRELLRSTCDQKEIERISRMIAKLYGTACCCIGTRNGKAA